MTDFVQTTLFGPKDSLPSGDPEKIILGADFDVEFANLVTSIASKADDADLATTDANVAANATAIATNASDIAALVSPVQQEHRTLVRSIPANTVTLDDQLSGEIDLDTNGYHSFEAYIRLITTVPAGAEVEIDIATSAGPLRNATALFTVASASGTTSTGSTFFAELGLDNGNMSVMVPANGDTLVHIVGSFQADGGETDQTLEISYEPQTAAAALVLPGSWVRVSRDNVS